MVKHVTTQEFDELLTQGKPVFADFFATWCGPCKMFAPVLEAVAQEEGYADRFEFVKVDVDEEEGLAARYQIMSVPTLMLLSQGEVVKKQAGALNAAGLKSFLED